MKVNIDIPKRGKPRNIKFPEHFEYEFENRIKLFVIEDKRFPIITARFVFKSGSAADNIRSQGKDGVSSLTAELLHKGTHGLNSNDIAERFEYYGTMLVSGSDYDASYFTFHSLEKYFGEMFGLSEELILDSVFSEDEIRNLKEIRINSLYAQYRSGEYLAHKAFNNKLGRESGYSHKPEGCICTLKSITRDEILKFYSDYFTPGNMLIVLVGDIKPERALKLVGEKFSKWQKKGINNIETSKYRNPERTELYSIHREQSVQSDICLGNAGISRNSPEFVPVVLLNTIFGGNFSSRINKNLREINGYTYGARSYFDCKKYSGEFLIETNVNIQYTLLSVNEIIKEMELMKKNRVTEEELENAKNYITGNFPLQFETANAVATKLLNMELYDIEKDFYDHYLARIYEVTSEEIIETAEKYFQTEKLIIAIAGDSEKINRNFEGKFSVQKINDADLIK
ncbi:MAG: insulinase family protein [Ignavibacteria bacterium]|nr:insulinase family protein [Ignavibacteria bacterium]